jgi:hypothetical protein
MKVLTDNRNTHNCISSGWERVKHGVPHGSVLGSLFLLYIKELSKITTKNATILYADDSSKE